MAVIPLRFDIVVVITFSVEGTLTFEWQSEGSLFAATLALAGIAAFLGACVPAARLARMPIGEVLNAR